MSVHVLFRLPENTTMPFDTLPAELRLHVYQYLPELQTGRQETVAPLVALTPGICRASKWLREETLPLYAGNASFHIQADQDAYPKGDRVNIWLGALGDAIKHVRNFNLSRHWTINGPTRWQGHVGFYFRMERVSDQWRASAGTYPVAHDLRGMRAESVELLQHVIREVVIQPIHSRDKPQLQHSDVQFIAAAMDVIATRPISAFDTEQSEAGRQRRRKAWMEMERGLYALSPKSEAPGALVTKGTFFTPY